MIEPTVSVNKILRQYSEEPRFKVQELFEQLFTDALEQTDWKKDYIIDVQIDFIEVPK